MNILHGVYLKQKSFFEPEKDTDRFTSISVKFFSQGENQLEEKMTKPFKQCQLLGVFL